MIEWVWTVECDSRSDILFQNNQIYILFFYKEMVSFMLIFFQVQKLTDNIQFILETVMMSTVVEVQVMFSWCNYRMFIIQIKLALANKNVSN